MSVAVSEWEGGRGKENMQKGAPFQVGWNIDLGKRKGIGSREWTPPNQSLYERRKDVEIAGVRASEKGALKKGTAKGPCHAIPLHV